MQGTGKWSFGIYGWALKPYQKLTRSFGYWWRFKNSFAIGKKERKERKSEKMRKIWWNAKLKKLLDRLDFGSHALLFS